MLISLWLVPDNSWISELFDGCFVLVSSEYGFVVSERIEFFRVASCSPSSCSIITVKSVAGFFLNVVPSCRVEPYDAALPLSLLFTWLLVVKFFMLPRSKLLLYAIDCIEDELSVMPSSKPDSLSWSWFCWFSSSFESAVVGALGRAKFVLGLRWSLSMLVYFKNLWKTLWSVSYLYLNMPKARSALNLTARMVSLTLSNFILSLVLRVILPFTTIS